MVVADLQVAKLTKKEQEALDRSLRISKRKPPKFNLKNIPARDQAQTPPYAILPLLPYLPKEWIVWESAASKYGFLGEALRALHGSTVIETGLELDGTDYLKTSPKGHVEVTNPPFSIKYEWLARAYDNRKPFALLLPFDTWASATAQSLFQRHGISVIILNRRVNFHMPNMKWDGKGSDYAVAWFCWGLPFLREPVTYGYIPLQSKLPKWMVRPDHRREITLGAMSMEDRLAIKHATNPVMWPAPTQERRREKRPERK